MRPMIVLGLVLVCLALISLIRVGALVDYSADGLTVKLRLGPFPPTLFPVKKKKPKREKKAETTAPAPEEEERPRKGGKLALVRQFLPLAAQAAGQLRRKIRIDRLELDLTLAGEDPAAVAMNYGRANAILGMLVPLIEHNFHVKERQIHTAVDFSASVPSVAILAAATLTVGQGVVLVVNLGIQALKILLRYRKQTSLNQKEAV